MNISMGAAILLAGVTLSTIGIVLFLLATVAGLVWIYLELKKEREYPLTLRRVQENPILQPDPAHWWESRAVFNPAAFVDGGRVHLFYRAMGDDGVSRIGYAWSQDGINFERLPYPVYDRGPGFDVVVKNMKLSYKTLTYDTDLYASGGGWGGCEDPRAIALDGRVYMSFGVFESWQSMRLAITSLNLDDLKAYAFKWAPHVVMSPKNQTHKNWVLFPEKIHGKFAILHALTPTVRVDYVRTIEELEENPIQSQNYRSGRPGEWDSFVRGAAAPPIKTDEGWLLLYHGADPATDHVGYKVGAMLLDLEDPTKILYRSSQPILEPLAWYENDWKPGVVYASGAVVFNGELIVYYGGGDKYIAAAKSDLHGFLDKLKHNQRAVLSPIGV